MDGIRDSFLKNGGLPACSFIAQRGKLFHLWSAVVAFFLELEARSSVPRRCEPFDLGDMAKNPPPYISADAIYYWLIYHTA